MIAGSLNLTLGQFQKYNFLIILPYFGMPIDFLRYYSLVEDFALQKVDSAISLSIQS